MRSAVAVALLLLLMAAAGTGPTEAGLLSSRYEAIEKPRYSIGAALRYLSKATLKNALKKGESVIVSVVFVAK
jgi:hypothetical protein